MSISKGAVSTRPSNRMSSGSDLMREHPTHCLFGTVPDYPRWIMCDSERYLSRLRDFEGITRFHELIYFVYGWKSYVLAAPDAATQRSLIEPATIRFATIRPPDNRRDITQQRLSAQHSPVFHEAHLDDDPAWRTLCRRVHDELPAVLTELKLQGISPYG